MIRRRSVPRKPWSDPITTQAALPPWTGPSMVAPIPPVPASSSSAIPPAALSAAAGEIPPGWNSLPIATSIAQLTAFFGLQRELLKLAAAWMAGVPYWDAKQMIARHVLEDAQHAEALLKRLHELKAAAAEHKQISGLDELIADLAAAPNGEDFLRGLYGGIWPWFAARLADYLAASDPVMDEPSRIVVGRMVDGLRARSARFAEFKPKFSDWEGSQPSAWCEYIRGRLAGVTLENGAFACAALPAHPPGHEPFHGVARVRRDRTFRTADKSELPREAASFEEKRFLVFYNHVQEMQFAESLGAILHETAEMPWAFHYDLARHMADEVRHATMGQARLEQLGVALTEVPMLTQHYEFRSNLDPLERFCLMTLVMEATAFERKRAHVELFEQQGDRVSALYESYDIKDEMLHANLGHLWVPVLLRVYHDSRSVAELTEHCRAQIAQVISEYPASAANMVKK